MNAVLIFFAFLQICHSCDVIIMAIRIGSRVVMKAKAAIKGTVLKATGRYAWDIKWDDGKKRDPYKSQQLKEPPAKEDAPPSSIIIAQGKCSIFFRLLLRIISSHIKLFPPDTRRS